MAPSFNLITQLVPANRRGTAMALQTIISTLLGIGLGPLLAGLLSDALQPAFGIESLRYALLLVSLPARMMAIADIFEALTAADRPYKKGKTLSEALGIMAMMCRDAHIDPELFGLFIEAEVYRHYAERFLEPQQIDAVDPQGLLRKAGLME